MATLSGDSTVEIAAPAETCWGVLLDPASYPQWYDTLDEVVVERRDEVGRAVVILVRSDVGAPLGSVEFRLGLVYVEPTRVTGRQIGKGSFVKDVANEWQLEPLGPARTRVTYTFSASSDGIRAAAAFGTVASAVRRHLIDGFTSALKARAER